MRTHRVIIFILLGVFSFELYSAGRGDSCDGSGTKREKMPESLRQKHFNSMHQVAAKIYDYLDQNVESVALIARSGYNLSQWEKLSKVAPLGERRKYTHMGFVWKSSKDNIWRIKHVLKPLGKSASDIFEHSLIDFLAGSDLSYYDVMVGQVPVSIQRTLALVLESDAKSRIFHNSNYSAIANPFSNKYQNSNGWPLVLVAAAAGVVGTPRIEYWSYGAIEDMGVREGIEIYSSVLSRGDFSSIQPSAWRRWMASLFFKSCVRLDDRHGRNNGSRYHFVSPHSVFRFLDAAAALVDQREICHLRGCDIPVKFLLDPSEPYIKENQRPYIKVQYNIDRYREKE